MAFRFTDLIRRDMIVWDAHNRYPQDEEVFERFRVRPSCWDCSMTEVAHRSGVSVEDLLDARNEVVFPRNSGEQEKQG